MWLKVVTVFLMIFSVVMLFAYFWIVGPKPPEGATKAENIAFMRRGAIFIGVEAAALIGSLIGSYLIARKARQEYREQSQRNLEALLEATLREHGRKKDENADTT